jgi:hypothetical protein
MKPRSIDEFLGGPRLALLAGGLLLGIHLVILPGCGSADIELAPAEGIVTLDGRPVEGAGVTFQSMAGGPAASGTTDSEGRFQLRTMNQPGAPLGEHIVLISKTWMDLPTTAAGQVDEAKLREVTDIEEKNLLPVRYSSPATSELRATIDNSGERMQFSLATDETVAKPEAEMSPPSAEVSPQVSDPSAKNEG